MKERYASSAVELLRIVDEMLNTYFALPVSQFPELLQDLVNGIDNALKIYATQAIGSCGKPFDHHSYFHLISHGFVIVYCKLDVSQFLFLCSVQQNF